jgi:hypothetical protein
MLRLNRRNLLINFDLQRTDLTLGKACDSIAERLIGGRRNSGSTSDSRTFLWLWRTMLLTKHENETFLNQTVYISGQAFVRCNFIACTLVLRETVYHLEGCTFERCNWHVDWVLMWGSPESIREIKALVSLIETAQQQQLPADQLNPVGATPVTPYGQTVK